MTAPSLAEKATDAFNRHGSFTARVIETGLAVEVRYVDSGNIAALVWPPSEGSNAWRWRTARQMRQGGESTRRPGYLAVEEIVQIVALYVLDGTVAR